MIVITHTPGKISVKGHAGYAPHGQDIVCAAISTLLQVFVEAVDKFTNDKINTKMAAGNAVILYEHLTEQAQLLMNAFLLGVEMIAESYPDNVKYVQALNT